jgi:hypothetical protein
MALAVAEKSESNANTCCEGLRKILTPPLEFTTVACSWLSCLRNLGYDHECMRGHVTSFVTYLFIFIATMRNRPHDNGEPVELATMKSRSDSL